MSTLMNFLLFAVVEAWKCSSCEVPYKAKGCFQDRPPPNRALKVQVLNVRDPQSKVYGGDQIDWYDWNNYMARFACRCAKIVKEKGWKVFGLQFYGMHELAKSLLIWSKVVPGRRRGGREGGCGNFIGRGSAPRFKPLYPFIYHF